MTRCLTLLLAILFATTPSLAAVPCLHYEGDPVILTGKVTLQTFYGPPSYGEKPDTDSREIQAILLLPGSVCVSADPSNSYEAETNQWKVTLVPPSGVNLTRYARKKVTVEGTLFHSHTGHHHTPVLMEVIRVGNAK